MGRLTQNIILTAGLLAVAPVVFALALTWMTVATVRALMEVWR